MLKIILFLSATLLLGVAKAKIDDSSDIFFPRSLSFLQKAQSEFPYFWWNFIVIESDDFAKAKVLCEQLKPQLQKEIKNLGCSDQTDSYLKTLKSWADDIILREPFTTDGTDKLGKAEKYLEDIKSSLIEMSMLSTSSQIFKLKQVDPLNQSELFLKNNESFTGNFIRQEGFLYDPQAQRIVIPVQFNQRPKMKNLEAVMQTISKFPEVYLVGGHRAAYANEKQVHQDLNLVSLIGLGAMAAFILYLLFLGRTAALLLIPPVAIALGLAALVTYFIYGSIHGLTLAFGSGIVGLTIDYGLHGAFNADSKQTWQSNLIGFTTTLVGLGVLAFSGIPLIQQMMIFGICGLFFGFVLFYLLCKYLPKIFIIKSFPTYFPQFKYSWIIVVLLIVVSLYGYNKITLSFDLRQFNFQTKADLQLNSWLYSKKQNQNQDQDQLLQIHSSGDVFDVSALEKKWSEENKIKYIGLANYIPGQNKQIENILTWNNQGCAFFKKNLNSIESKIFSSFIKNICEKRAPINTPDLNNTEYLNDLVSSDKIVSVFLSENAVDKLKIKSHFPQAKSVADAVNGFSEAIAHDLKWMMPLALVLCFFILYGYYKNFSYVFIALIPFFTGLGLFFAVSIITNRHLDLISILGLLMVFGFSVDYGVFATDSRVFSHKNEEIKHVDTALWLAAITNTIGFFPMVFVKHPILYQLGFALFYGTLGAYLGTKWGVPTAISWVRSIKKDKQETNV